MDYFYPSSVISLVSECSCLPSSRQQMMQPVI